MLCSVQLNPFKTKSNLGYIIATSTVCITADRIVENKQTHCTHTCLKQQNGARSPKVKPVYWILV